MHDPRISTALRQLAELGDEPAPPRWSWAVVGLERIGRIRLPAPAIQVLGVSTGGGVWARSSRLALVLDRIAHDSASCLVRALASAALGSASEQGIRRTAGHRS